MSYRLLIANEVLEFLNRLRQHERLLLRDVKTLRLRHADR